MRQDSTIIIHIFDKNIFFKYWTRQLKATETRMNECLTTSHHKNQLGVKQMVFT